MAPPPLFCPARQREPRVMSKGSRGPPPRRRRPGRGDSGWRKHTLTFVWNISVCRHLKLNTLSTSTTNNPLREAKSNRRAEDGGTEMERFKNTMYGDWIAGRAAGSGSWAGARAGSLDGPSRGIDRSCFACWLRAKGRGSWRERTWQAGPAFCALEATRTPALARARVLGLLRESPKTSGGA